MAARTARGSALKTAPTGRNAITRTPVTAPLQRVFAPEIRFTALREKDPPTGKPAVAPATTLASPWLTNSALASHCVPSS